MESNAKKSLPRWVAVGVCGVLVSFLAFHSAMLADDVTDGAVRFGACFSACPPASLELCAAGCGATSFGGPLLERLTGGSCVCKNRRDQQYEKDVVVHTPGGDKRVRLGVWSKKEPEHGRNPRKCDCQAKSWAYELDSRGNPTVPFMMYMRTALRCGDSWKTDHDFTTKLVVNRKGCGGDRFAVHYFKYGDQEFSLSTPFNAFP